MSSGFLVSLAAVVIVALGGRLTLPAVPLGRLARAVTALDASVVGVGLLGLGFHCGAMFFRSMAERLPGAEPSIRQIDALGHASVAWYVVPAVLTVLGLRHQHPIAPAGVGLALGGVGITMYGGSSLQTHLTAIFISVVVLASVLALLVLPPWRRRSTFLAP